MGKWKKKKKFFGKIRIFIIIKLFKKKTLKTTSFGSAPRDGVDFHICNDKSLVTADFT